MSDKYEQLLSVLDRQKMLPVAVAQATCPERPEQIIPKLLELGVSPAALTISLAEVFDYLIYDPAKHGTFSCRNEAAGWGYANGVLFVSSPFNIGLQPAALLPGTAWNDLRGVGLMPISDTSMTSGQQVYGQVRAEEIVDKWLHDALAAAATDIHITPLTPKYVRVRIRVDGQLQTLEEFESDSRDCNYEFISNVLLRLANSQTGSFVHPVDGRFERTPGGRKVEVRLAMRPVNVEGGVSRAFYLRLLYSSKSLVPGSLSTLGFSQSFLDVLAVTRCLNQGLVLITGPTGSGKTTTLYTNLTEIIKDDPWRSIQTLEDPVEQNIRGAEQTQISEQAGMDFHTGLKALMRSDVDVILVGEVRDPETARLAIRASYTGHLVFATLHAQNAVFSIERLQDFGISSKTLSSVLVAVIAQRLLRKVCPHCATSTLFREHPEQEDFPGLLGHEEVIQRANPKGCGHCYYGYKGRQVVAEVLFLDSALLAAVAGESSALELTAQAMEQGYRTLWDEAAGLVRSGKTTIDECRRNLPPYHGSRH